ncbi:MAG: diaminopimelate decarboxylase [Syntrophales bacterium]
MNYFNYKDNELYCEEVSIAAIAREIGTPFYLYSARTLKRHFTAFTEAFAGIPHIICFAVKANSNIAILKSFANQGGGADIVSGGELYRALQAGIEPARIVYSGVGKRDDEIDFALKTGILMFNIESPQELEVINERAGKLGLRAGIGIRVNPDVNAETHPHISTGLKENKFGIAVESALLAYRQAAALKHIDIKGVSCHIGSQITKILPFTDAIDRLKTLIRTLRAEGVAVHYLDLGGGLGISYDQEKPPLPAEYARAIIEAAGDLGCTFIFEPGRVLVGNAGILVTKVLYKKENDAKKFFIVDAGMNDLIRPSLYGSFHKLQPVQLTAREEVTADIVGPICESGDFLAKGRRVKLMERGDLLAVMSAGAYGFTMSSNYNSRPRAPEIMVCDASWHVIREREKNEDLIRNEHIPYFLKS